MKSVTKRSNEMITSNLTNDEPEYEEMDNMIKDNNIIKITDPPRPTSTTNLISPLKTKKNANLSITILVAEPLDDTISTISQQENQLC